MVLLYIIAKIKFSIIFKLFFKLKVTGQQNIPQDSPFIIVANHSSLLDPVILGVSIRPKIIFIAASYLFEIRWLGYLLRKANSIPINRENYTNNVKSLKQALKILQKGGVLGIFPEGGVDRQKDDLPIKAGAAFLATRVGVPIVPIKIKGADKVLPRGAKFIRSLNKIEVEIKKPIYCSRQTNKNKEIIERVVKSYIKEIY
ncbi:1-acyl-sn-glycerol-3-phosphate acyltransferase [Candidatus Atribacteria bacterium 1244-E10-H5-B2]|nr:MAG: 1-acyl-sn-glycerol-3-phosphate acyltransferase [Candidatus Atribacteria bacterium 1244-E10-H5-B2]